MKEYLRYISSNIMAMIGISLYVLADTYFIALGVGSQGLTALNLALPFFNVMSATGFMCGVGGSTRYALFRESETRKANTIYSTTLLFGIILGIIMIVIGQLFHYQLAYLVGARGRILTMTSTYIQTVTMFAPAFILNYTTENFIKNDQAPGLAMSASLIGNFANIVLDYILIFPMHMGMRGAALATGMAPLISLTLYGTYMVKEKGTLKIVKGYLYQEIKHIFLLGFPAFFNELANGLIILVFNALLLHYSGNLAVAAYGIVTNVSIIIICIYNGLAHGSQPLWSRYFARQDAHQYRAITRYAYRSLAVIAIFLYLVIYAFTGVIVAAFNSQQVASLTALSITGMHLYFIGIFFMGFNILTIMYLITQQRSFPAHIISLGKGLFLVLPVAFVMAFLFKVPGIFLAMPITEGIMSLYSLYQIRKKTKIRT